MIVKLFGFLDLLSGINLILLNWNLFNTFGIILGIYLILKSLYFIKDIASLVDIIIGIFLLLASFGYYFPLNWLFAVWLLQKAIFSLKG